MNRRALRSILDNSNAVGPSVGDTRMITFRSSLSWRFFAGAEPD
jgi:hypothetical protein